MSGRNHAVRLEVLGSAQVIVDGRPKPIPAKGMALLILLAGNPGLAWSRSRLSSWLWPHSGKSSARHSLSQLVYTLKKSLGATSVHATPVSLKLGDVTCDLTDFRTALANRDWLGAAVVFAGPLALDLKIDVAVEFEHWLDQEQRDVATRAKGLAKELGSAMRWSEALGVIDGLEAYAPLDASLTRIKMRGLVEQGKHDRAEEFLASLPSELAEEAQEIMSRNLPGTSLPTSNFVGRSDAMSWLEKRYENAVRRQATFALVEGEPGVGKTTLIDRFSRLAALRGARVLTAVAYEAESNLPFGIVGQWLQELEVRDLKPVANEPWMAHLRAVFPGMAGEGQGHDGPGKAGMSQHRILESLRRLLTYVARSRPLVLVLDDIHLADPTSLTLLHYLLRRTVTTPILALGSTRVEKGFNSESLKSWGFVQRYHLSGLSQPEVRNFIEQARFRTAWSSSDVEHIHHLTAGNPLLLSTLLRERPQDVSNPVQRPPKSIVEFFRPRLEKRPETDRQILGVLAMLGEPARLDLLQVIAGLDRKSIDETINRLNDGWLVALSDQGVTLRHGLVGEVALSMLNAAEKQSLYGRTARMLEAEGENPTMPFAALSHDLAGNRKSAFEASVNAATACDVLHAVAEKIFFLKLALSNAPNRNAEARIRLDLAETYVRRKELPSALEVLGRESFPAESAELRDRAELLRMRIQAEMTGDGELVQQLWAKARTVGRNLPMLEAGDAYKGIAGVAYDLGLDWVAAEIAEELAGAVSQVPLTSESAYHLLRPITISGLLAGYAHALDWLQTLPEPAQNDLVYRTSYLSTKATLLVASGALKEAEELFARCLGITERYALYDYSYTVHNNIGVCLMEQGQHSDAERHFDAAISYAPPDVSPSHHSTAKDNLTILAYERAEFHQAFQMSSDLLASNRISGVRSTMSLLAIGGLCALELGKLTECRGAERELRILLKRHGQFGNDLSYVFAFLARMEALRGDYQSAVQGLREAADYYRGKNVLARARVECELYTLLMKNGRDCQDQMSKLLAEVAPTGAVPVSARIQELIERGSARA